MTTADITQSVEYALAKREEHLQKFYDFLRIPSISTDPAYKKDIERAAEWVVSELKRLGFDRCELIPTAGHPVVYGEWLKAGDDRPTVIIYAHYDVQPADPLDLWLSAPFEPEIRDGKLYARGVVDDKSGVWGNIVAFESMLEATGRLPINIKVFFEGEEECGSPNMEPFIKANLDRLRADLLIISDSGCTPPVPVIPYSVRGIVGAEVTVTGPENDFHSGMGGGVLHNPVHMVSRIIASFHDDRGHILIPGAYEGATPLTEDERAKFDAAEAYTIQSIEQGMGDFRVWGEPEYNFVERMTARPSLDVNGIYGGYQGDGFKTIIPARAGFKVTMRLAPGQDPDDIAGKLIAHIMGFACDTVDIEVSIGQGSWPALMLNDGPIIDALNRAYEAGWGQSIDFTRSGGSVPIIGMFQREMGMPITAMGLGTGALVHAPNEHLLLDYFHININTAIHFYHYLAESFDD